MPRMREMRGVRALWMTDVRGGLTDRQGYRREDNAPAAAGLRPGCSASLAAGEAVNQPHRVCESVSDLGDPVETLKLTLRLGNLWTARVSLLI